MMCCNTFNHFHLGEFLLEVFWGFHPLSFVALLPGIGAEMCGIDSQSKVTNPSRSLIPSWSLFMKRFDDEENRNTRELINGGIQQRR